jgi:hypothetical protein
MLQRVVELFQGTGASSGGKDDLNRFREVERLKRRHFRHPWILSAIGSHETANIRPQLRKRDVVADVDTRQLLRQLRPVETCEDPLGEVVREALGEKVMLPEALKRVVENRRVASLFNAAEQLLKRGGLLIVDAR